MTPAHAHVASAPQRFDAVIIGGGHNGLVCAAISPAPGCRSACSSGAASSAAPRSPRNSIPGFRNSTASYTVSLLDPQVIRDLRLARARARRSSSGRSRISCRCPATRYLKVGGGLAATQAEVAQFSRARRRARCRRTTRCSIASPTCCATLLLADAAQRRRRRCATLLDAWKVGASAFARSIAPAQRDVLDLFTKSAGDLLDRWFESAPIKAAFGFDAVVGNFASPYTPGSAYVLLHHVFGEVNGKRGQWGHALRRHGRDHAGDGGGVRARAASRSAPTRAGCARASSKAAARSASSSTDGEVDRARAASSPTSIRSSCSSSWSTPRARRRRFPRAHRRLPLRLRHVPDERRAVRAAGFQLRCPGRDAQPHHAQRHHHRAVARLHGARVFRRAHRRLVAGADRRGADPVDRRRHARAAGHARRKPLLPARASATAGGRPGARGTMRATRSPT